jgi:acid phosphatase (class A)
MWVRGATTRVVAAALLMTTACVEAERRANDRVYPVAAALDATRLLRPPPSGDSERARDLEAVRAAQRARTSEQAAWAEATSKVDLFVFASILGSHFARERVPTTAAFLRRVYRSALPSLEAAKYCWNRLRPFEVDPTLEPLALSLAGTRTRATPQAARSKALPGLKNPVARVSYVPSYPSGHALVGTMVAVLLAEMVPEKCAVLLALGRAYGDARVVSGVHFPSDVEGGRVLGTALVETMQRNERFRVDRRDALEELRDALGYGSLADAPRRKTPASLRTAGRMTSSCVDAKPSTSPERRQSRA